MCTTHSRRSLLFQSLAALTAAAVFPTVLVGCAQTGDCNQVSPNGDLPTGCQTSPSNGGEEFARGFANAEETAVAMLDRLVGDFDISAAQGLLVWYQVVNGQEEMITNEDDPTKEITFQGGEEIVFRYVSHVVVGWSQAGQDQYDLLDEQYGLNQAPNDLGFLVSDDTSGDVRFRFPEEAEFNDEWRYQFVEDGRRVVFFPLVA